MMFRFSLAYPPREHVEKLQERAKTPNAPCQKEMLAWADCVKEAQTSYVEEGKDTKNSSEWAAYHLRKCLHPFVDARECQVGLQAKVVRNLKKHATEEQWEEAQKRLRYSAHKSIGLEKFEETWRPDMDYSGYFKAYRAFMEEQFKLEDELKKEMADGGIPAEPYKYIPKRFVYKGD